ncbi:hypothetical protein CMQ_5368 [Grosmannia clavigera kw1407]|uniref:RING-type domain-containing protein n=1 Tax=Grosmannia clavigera (strain kw1407 / UAMH 11150) TaxID=655863 RepID=F0XBL8_GROCL|nr:uncharacterized protein CMQ_5368 [Grosmannia clavigera kw1407]EFX05106.1 hypothetical protein CMQ_5368 [Grosmannia clavigera kw1407]
MRLYGDSLSCSVCYDKLPDVAVVFKCGHFFCTACYNDVLGNGICPMCRKLMRGYKYLALIHTERSAAPNYVSGHKFSGELARMSYDESEGGENIVAGPRSVGFLFLAVYFIMIAVELVVAMAPNMRVLGLQG